MTINITDPTDYLQCEEVWLCSRRRKLANNTYLVETAEGYGIRLHSTIVLEHTPTRTTWDTGGWQTVTTKDRMNRFSRGVCVYSERGIWFLSVRVESALLENAEMPHLGDDPYSSKFAVYPFADGITLDSNGVVSGAGEDPAAKRKLAKRIRAYSKRYFSELASGNVDAPGAGDCLYCGLFTAQDGSPVGNFGGEEHLLSHLDEPYYVPSLLARAIERFPVSQFASAWLSDRWAGTANFPHDIYPLQSNGAKPFALGIAEDQLSKSLRRYMGEQLGLSLR